MIQSVKKAMDILTVLSENSDEPIMLSELAEKTGLNKSTCAHIVDTLCESFYVERVSRKEGYRLGPWAYMLSRYGGYHRPLIKISSSVLKWLRKQTGATVFISVLCNGRKFIVYHIDDAGILPMSDGSIIQGYIETTATGRLLLAYQDTEDFNYTINRRCNDPNYSPFEVTPEFREELRTIRQNGYSYVSVDVQHTQSYAFRVLDGNRTAAALGILYSNEKDSPEYRSMVLKAGRTAANEISRRLSALSMDKAQADSIGTDKLVQDLQALGVKKGMNIMVHSSLSKLGYIEGGADTVIDALMEAVGSSGTILMPAFNQGRAYWAGEIFDPRSTPTVNGAIPERFRKRDGVLRSLNPTHSFAAWGKNAARYTADHLESGCMGVDSPLHRLMQDGGYCLMLGTDFARNTFHHVVEVCENVPCLRQFGERYEIVLPDGSRGTADTWSWRDSECPIDDTGRYTEAMRSVEKRGYVGKALSRLYLLSDAYPIIRTCLKSGIGNVPGCSGCSIRPRVNEYTIK